MRRVLREHEEGQSRKASTAKSMKFSGEKIIAAKSGNILPYFKVNLSDSQTLPLNKTNLLHLKKKFWPLKRVQHIVNVLCPAKYVLLCT